jgi:hypothetical protein
MFELIIQCLSMGELRGVSKEIDIAKGVNKAPLTFSEGWKQYKRKKAWQKRG